MEKSSLHILYTLTGVEGNMDIYNYPDNWFWIGSGPVNPIYVKNDLWNKYIRHLCCSYDIYDYEYEEQFSGPKTSEKDMI